MDKTEDTVQPEEISPFREDFAGTEDDNAAVSAAPARRREWETYLRCFFLLAVVFFLSFLSWQPGILRLHVLASLTHPSRGESLAWKPEDEILPPPPQTRRTRPPDEWRLASSLSGDWHARRPAAQGADPRPGSLSDVAWRRFSVNPWLWRDDSVSHRRRVENADDSQPPQKPASAIRVGNIFAFPASEPAPFRTVADFSDLNPGGSESPAAPLPSSPSPAESAVLPQPFRLPDPAAGGMPGFGNPQLPPFGPMADALNAPSPAAAPSLQTPEAASAVPATGFPDSARPPVPPPGPAPADIDWKNREITGPIPDAYLTVYPKLKFIGLCVPGQGYVRKYNQIGVPADTVNPKAHARDGRTPYGRYYIADRIRDADGARLYLSWPSPGDAERAGLSPQETLAVETAWRRQGLPPQNTRAGGGIVINGLRQWVETTEGGFTLEEPHIEEIFTALPAKAWVFIQP